jgi:hypothetical protein
MFLKNKLNLAKSSRGPSPLWLRHKIAQRNTVSVLILISSISLPTKLFLLLFLCLFAVFRCLFSLVLLLLLITVAAGFEVRLRRGQR